jgi:integrase
MPQLKLTEKAIDRLAAPAPGGKQILFWDTDVKGLAVLCSGTTNAKTFVVQRGLKNGRTRRVTIGRTNTLSLEEAKEQAGDQINDLRHGIDPKRKLGNPTLREALDGYLAARKNLSPASIRVYRQVERTLAAWLDKPLREITGDMVEGRHRALAAEIGNFTANAALRSFGIFYNHALEQAPDLPANPVRRLKRQWYPEPPRRRKLAPAQMPAFYDAVLALDNAVQRDYLLFLMYTGCRRTEASTLLWSNVDLDEKVIHLQAADTKGKRNFDLPMSDVIYELLKARRALGNTGHVFPSSGQSGHLRNPGLDAVAEASGIRISCHDLRRGFVTAADKAGVSGFCQKVLVNHSTRNDVTANYNIIEEEDLRAAAQKVANKITAMCRSETAQLLSFAR